MLKAIKKGFTLVEVAIAVAIVAALTGAVAVVVSQNASDAAGDVSDIDTLAGQAQSTADGLSIPTVTTTFG